MIHDIVAYKINSYSRVIHVRPESDFNIGDVLVVHCDDNTITAMVTDACLCDECPFYNGRHGCNFHNDRVDGLLCASRHNPSQYIEYFGFKDIGNIMEEL